MRAGILVPTVFAICFIGAYQGSSSFGDLVVLIAFGLIGWIMKQYGWARAPLILGYILGKLIEKYLFISMGRYQFEWLERPGVIAIFAVTILVLARPVVAAIFRARRAAPVAPDAAATTIETCAIERIIGPALWGLAALGFAAAFWSAMDWRLAARLMPQTAATAGLIVIGCAGATMIVARLQGRPAPMMRARARADGGVRRPQRARMIYRRLRHTRSCGSPACSLRVLVVGMLPAIGLYMFVYMVTEGRTRLVPAVLITISLWIGMYLLFQKLLHVPWPPSLLGDELPWLRTMLQRLI